MPALSLPSIFLEHRGLVGLDLNQQEPAGVVNANFGLGGGAGAAACRRWRWRLRGWRLSEERRLGERNAEQHRGTVVKGRRIQSPP